MQKVCVSGYIVNRSGKLPKALRGQAFSTYESARSQVRKYLRSKFAFGGRETPSMIPYGFGITKT